MVTRTKAKPKEKALSSHELDAIIRICNEKGVAELTFGDLHILFHPKDGKEVVPQKILPETKPPEAEISAAQYETQNQQSLVQEELRMRESQVDHLLITDPLQAEQLIEEGELVEDDESDDADDGNSESTVE
jgi:hypothetical protein